MPVAVVAVAVVVVSVVATVAATVEAFQVDAAVDVAAIAAAVVAKEVLVGLHRAKAIGFVIGKRKLRFFSRGLLYLATCHLRLFSFCLILPH